MKLTSRQENILLAIVKEYINTAEPVGSQSLLNKQNFVFSSATLRNEMAALEEMGYLNQPHASAGRIPSDKAYRFYVDRLMQEDIPPPPEAISIRRQYQYLDAEMDRLVQQTAKLLADLTRYTSLVLAPQIRKTLFKYLKLLPLGPRIILMVLLTNTGSMVKRMVEVTEEVNPETLEKVASLLNERLNGISLAVMDAPFMEFPSCELDKASLMREIGRATAEAARDHEGRLFYEGTSHLLAVPEFRDLNKLQTILEFLEEEKLVAEILGKTLSSPGLQVGIGSENHCEEMRNCAMITATYQIGGKPLGTIGVIGPTRMPYRSIISIVDYVAGSFSDKLNRITGD
jgi:heat-inducible transcriptional repressor